jgi:hypothetical protein
MSDGTAMRLEAYHLSSLTIFRKHHTVLFAVGYLTKIEKYNISALRLYNFSDNNRVANWIAQSAITALV